MPKFFNPFICASLALAAILQVGCQEPSKPVVNPDVIPETTSNRADEPDRITVQHCLIAFDGTLPGKIVERDREQAKKLANELLESAKSGEDFAKIIERYTDDSPPGIYEMVNTGLTGDVRQKLYNRDGMVPAFGNVGFTLEVGEFGLADYDNVDSPFGWHIIKRIK